MIIYAEIIDDLQFFFFFLTNILTKIDTDLSQKFFLEKNTFIK